MKIKFETQRLQDTKFTKSPSSHYATWLFCRSQIKIKNVPSPRGLMERVALSALRVLRAFVFNPDDQHPYSAGSITAVIDPWHLSSRLSRPNP